MVLNTLRGAPQQLVDRSALPGLGANSMMSGGTPSSARILTLQAAPRAPRAGRGDAQPSSKRSAQERPTTAMLKLFEDAMRLPAMILPSRWQALEWRDGECPKILHSGCPPTFPDGISSGAAAAGKIPATPTARHGPSLPLSSSTSVRPECHRASCAIALRSPVPERVTRPSTRYSSGDG